MRNGSYEIIEWTAEHKEVWKLLKRVSKMPLHRTERRHVIIKPYFLPIVKILGNIKRFIRRLWRYLASLETAAADGTPCRPIDLLATAILYIFVAYTCSVCY